jgi:hypothetical protein
MRILIAYPGPTHSTYDVAAGYEKALRQLGHDVYGFPYHKWFGFYDAALTHWAERTEQYEKSQNDVVLHSSEKLVVAAVEFRPDVILVVSGSALHRHAYDLLHGLVPVVLLLTESPYEDSAQARIIEQGHVAHAFTNERLSVDRLGETGVSVTYFPHSFDPDVHRPTRQNGDGADVFFHGTLWPERTQLFDEIESRLPGVNLRLSGISIEPHGDGALVDNGDLAKMYGAAKICLNHHRRFASKPGEYIPAQSAHSIGPRAYEIAACGAFQLCDDMRPELWEVFGHSVPTYTDAADLVARIEYFIDRPDERRELADLARERVQDCTFVRRAQEIVEPVLRRL